MGCCISHSNRLDYELNKFFIEILIFGQTKYIIDMIDNYPELLTKELQLKVSSLFVKNEHSRSVCIEAKGTYNTLLNHLIYGKKEIESYVRVSPMYKNYPIRFKKIIDYITRNTKVTTIKQN
jgi:hypothetical protein